MLAAGDLVEGVNRERRRAVRRRQQIGVDAQRRARLQIRRRQLLVDPVRPDDLLGGGHRLARRVARASRSTARVSTDSRNSRRPTAKMPPLRRISSSLGDKRHRL